MTLANSQQSGHHIAEHLLFIIAGKDIRTAAYPGK